MSKKMSMSEAGRLGGIKSAPIVKERSLKLQESYNSKPNCCKFCNDALSYQKRKNKFCSHSCSASFNNLGVCRNALVNDGKVYNTSKLVHISFCKNCKKVLRGRKLRNIYCSNRCQQDCEWNASKSKIEAEGKFEGKYSARRYIEEKIGNDCAICSRDAVWENKPLKLIVDHINGNAEDWSISNIRLICPNCDSQTSTFKGRNMGNGRHFRRERYKKGLSY